MSSPYVTLGNKPLEQWKVTELKEELKRRKLTTKGLKEDLLKRLDEAVRIELQSEAEDADNGLTDATQSEVPIEQETAESFVSGKSNDVMGKGIGMGEKVDSKTGIDDHRRSLGEGKLVETDLVQASGLEGEQMAQLASVETTVVVSTIVEPVTASIVSHLQERLDGLSIPVPDDDRLEPSKEDTKRGPSDPSSQFPPTNENTMPVLPPFEQSLLGSEAQKEAMNSTTPLKNDDSESLLPDHNAEPLKYQVSEVDPNLGFKVISDSISTESVSIIEKNEKKVDVITDNVKIELDVKHEMVQTSLSSVVPDGGELHPMDVDQPLDKNDTGEPLGKKEEELLFGKTDKSETTDRRDVEEPVDKKLSLEETAVSNAEIAESLKNIDRGDLDPPEKLSLDRSSGDDSLEEDVIESKQVEYKSSSDKIEGNVDKSKSPIGEEDAHVDVVGLDKPIETKVTSVENETPVLTSVKRKFNDKVAVGSDDTVKRVRRWNIEGSKGSEPQSSSVVASSTPKDISQSTARRLSGTDSAEEALKERIVPPSSKPPTSSLRIDRFLRPFTLKAVQELLGKTGTVTRFWMDQIKTHCYVSYLSVEEAVETRNAVYNLQWPPNGGRMLVAEFVDPQEVKTRVEAPSASPATPAAAQNQSTVPPQPSPCQLALRQQQLPPPPPPPPLANPPGRRDRLQLPAREQQPLPAKERLNLPPPPAPVAEKVEQPIVTLDDLFRKTKATPRIYYLPLSDEEVAAKLNAQVCRWSCVEGSRGAAGAGIVKKGVYVVEIKL